MRLPHPAQDVDEGNLFGIIDYPDSLGVSSPAAASLLVGWVGSEASAVTDCRGVDAVAGEAPDALLGPPEASIGEDGDLVSVRDLGDRVSQNVMPEAIDISHWSITAGQGLLRFDQLSVATSEHVEDGANAALDHAVSTSDRRGEKRR